MLEPARSSGTPAPARGVAGVVVVAVARGHGAADAGRVSAVVSLLVVGAEGRASSRSSTSRIGSEKPGNDSALARANGRGPARGSRRRRPGRCRAAAAGRRSPVDRRCGMRPARRSAKRSCTASRRSSAAGPRQGFDQERAREGGVGRQHLQVHLGPRGARRQPSGACWAWSIAPASGPRPRRRRPGSTPPCWRTARRTSCATPRRARSRPPPRPARIPSRPRPGSSPRACAPAGPRGPRRGARRGGRGAERRGCRLPRRGAQGNISVPLETRLFLLGDPETSHDRIEPRDSA